MSFSKTIWTAGFAMFTMFFGAGNLVFPLVIGTQTFGHSGIAILGLTITGVIVPFLGLIGVILYDGNHSNFFGSIGRIPAIMLVFCLLAILGPLGVVPRCIVVAYGAVTSFYPNISIEIFSFIFCLLTFILIWNHDKVVPIMGRIMTPFFLFGILIISIAGLFFTNDSSLTSDFSSSQAFKVGLINGYQTMDLLAAFFFSTTIVAYIRAHMRSDDSPKTLLKLSFAASLIGAGLIGLIYIGFVVLGAKHSLALVEAPAEQIFSLIAGRALGPIAVPIVAITITLACITTAAILSMLFSDFMHTNILRYKLSQRTCTLLTLIIAFFISLLGFESLSSWIRSILQVAYPALIVLTITNILNKIWNFAYLNRLGFWATIVASAAYFSLK